MEAVDLEEESDMMRVKLTQLHVYLTGKQYVP